jgi:tetratricopeptide (TPR) repeat protein
VTGARRYFDQGLEHFRTGDFDAAVIDFEAAFRSNPHPAALFNLGRAFAAAGRPVEAASTLERYLAEQGTVVSAERRATVESLIASQKRRLGTIVVRAEPGVAVSVDGVAAGDTPLKSPVSVAPGNHALVATRSGFLPEVLAVRLEAAETRELDLKLEPLPTALPAAPPDAAPVGAGDASTQPQERPDTRAPSLTAPGASTKLDRVEPGTTARSSHVLARVGTGSVVLGIASAALGEYFAVRAKDSWRDRNQHCGANGCDDEAVKDWQDAKDDALGADICFGMGLAAVGAGVYMLIAQPADAPKPRSAQLSVNHQSNAWLVQLGGHFE